MSFKNIIILCIFVILAIWFLKLLIKTFKDVKDLFISFKQHNINKLTDNEKDLIIKEEIFGKLTKEQKYAYIYTLEAFFTLADNVRDKIVVDNKSEVEEIQETMIASISDYTLTLLSMTPEDADKAIEFFDEHFYKSPQDYLKEIEDHVVLDGLLFSCAKVVETKRGFYNGQDINKMANDFLHDLFGDLGYTSEMIEQTISKIEAS